MFSNSWQFFTFVTHTYLGPPSIFVRKAATVGKLFHSLPFAPCKAVLDAVDSAFSTASILLRRIYSLEDKLYKHFPKVNVINFRQRKQNIPQKKPIVWVRSCGQLAEKDSAHMCVGVCECVSDKLFMCLWGSD